MDLEDGEDEERGVTLAPSVYAALVAFLFCLGTVPLFLWLADQRLIPWADEVRWQELRRNPDAPTRELSSTDRIEIRRTMCFGLCPAYTLVLFASGRVEYFGEHFVCAVGRRIAQVDARAATKLIADFVDSGYFELAWKTGDLATDAPTVYTRLIVGARSRGIEHYHGDRGAPRDLLDMERTIDDVAGTARWLPIRDGHERYCLGTDGKRMPSMPSIDSMPPGDAAGDEVIAPH